MNSLIFASIVGVLIAFVGIRIKKLYRDRVAYLEDYKTFLSELIEEISFYRSPMDIFIDRVLDTKSASFKRTLESYKESIYDSREIVIDRKLKDHDKNIIQNCFSRIGRNDVSTELININNDSKEAEKLLDVAKYELKSRGELMSKLMILLGIAAMILLV